MTAQCTSTRTREQQIKAGIELDLENRAADIWEWVRENRNSLDSGRGRRMLGEAFDKAVEAVCESIAPLLTEISQLKLKLSVVKNKAVSDCDERDKTIKTLQKEAKSLRKELDELRAKAVEVH